MDSVLKQVQLNIFPIFVFTFAVALAIFCCYLNHYFKKVMLLRRFSIYMHPPVDRNSSTDCETDTTTVPLLLMHPAMTNYSKQRRIEEDRLLGIIRTDSFFQLPTHKEDTYVHFAEVDNLSEQELKPLNSIIKPTTVESKKGGQSGAKKVEETIVVAENVEQENKVIQHVIKLYQQRYGTTATRLDYVDLEYLKEYRMSKEVLI